MKELSLFTGMLFPVSTGINRFADVGTPDATAVPREYGD